MTWRRLAFVIFALLGLFSKVCAQKSIQDSSISFNWVSVAYSANLPTGELADRFGLSNLIGIEYGHKFQNNFYLWTGPRFLFGSQVRETIGSNILLSAPADNGKYLLYGIGPDGLLKEVRLFERGVSIPLLAGKIIPLGGKPNPNCGLYVEGGGQFLQHRVHIETIGEVPALSGTLRDGYDRLTNGLGLVEGFGYRYYSNSRLLNFHIGVEFSQNFTRSRRSYNYDLGTSDTHLRVDQLMGLRAGWSVLIYREAPRDLYYY